MANKLQDVIQLAEEHANEICSGSDTWMDYLNTASRLYRYSFEDQLLIHAQRPDATACASYEVWNKKMGCYVKRGSKGIALIDENGNRPKLHYVFDISSVGKTANGRYPVLWNLKDEQRNDLSDYILDAYDLNRDISYNLNDTLFLLARNLADNNAEEAVSDMLLSPESSSLGSDVRQVSVKFQFVLFSSVYYILAKRCGYDPKQYLAPDEAFQDISDFHNHTLITFLGDAVQRTCEPVLRDIGRFVRKNTLEKSKLALEKQTQIGYNEHQTINGISGETDNYQKLTGGMAYGEAGVHTQGGLSVPEPDNIDRGAGGRDREVRNAEEVVSEGATRGELRSPSSDGGALETSGGRGSAVSGAHGGIDEGSGGEISQSGQGDRPDGLGGTSEQSEINRGGEHLSGIDLHLADSIEPELEYDEAEAEIVSALNLPEISSMDTQIREIEERQAAVFAGADSVPADVIDTILRTGGNKSGSLLRLIHNYMSEQSVEDYTEFVRTEYGTGGKGFIINGQEYAVWFDPSGMQIAAGRSVHDQTLDRALLSWADVSGRIHQLLNQGEYAPQVVLDAARAAVIKEHAGSLEFFRREMVKDMPELVFKDMTLFKGGFPDVEEKLSVMLNDQNELNELVARLDGFRKVWVDHPEVMTSRLYNPEKMYQQFRRLSLKTVPFLARAGFSVEEQEVFITQDEIDTYLQRGTPYGDGRISVYSFFLMNRDADARTDFVKQKYGDGGHSNALSGADDSWADYDSKGLLLRRNGLGEGSVKVLLTWPKVRKRIEYLLDNGLFLKGSDYDHMDEFERKAIASRINGFFYRLVGSAADTFAERFGGLGFIATADLPKEILYESLADEATRNEVLQLMESAFAEVPIDSESYENKRKLLSEVRGYVEGTFTIFPENNAVITETQTEESITDANEKENRYEVIESEGWWAEKTWTVQDNHTGELYHDRYDEPNFFRNKADAEDFCAELNENYQIERGENLHQMSLFDMAATDYILQKNTEFASEDEIEERRDTFEDINPEEVQQRPEESGIANGEAVDPEKPEQNPLILQAMEDVEQLASEEGRGAAVSDRFHVVDVDWHLPSKSDIKYSIWDDVKNGYYVDENGDKVGFISRWEAAKYRDGLISLEDAKGLIKEYLRDEFGIDDEEDFIDLTNIGLGYTTISDEEIPIEASADLVNFRVERKLNERVFDVRQYDSLDKLIVEELENLDFNDLMDATDEQIEEALSEVPDFSSLEGDGDASGPSVDAQGFRFRAGDTVYLENSTAFVIDSIGEFDIHMHDPSLKYPIGRVESRESFQRLMEQYMRNQPAPVAARYQSTMHMQDGYTEDIAILLYPNGQFFIHCNFDEERGTGAAGAGPYDSLEDARTVVMALTPDAVEVPMPEIEHETVQEPVVDAAEDATHEGNKSQPQNFRITDDALGVGGQKTKYKVNIAAVKLLKQLEAENRLATPEEQEVLSRYVGWGGIPQAFDHTSLPWTGEYEELQETLTKEEYREARSSTLNAFYTPPVVVKAMYEALENFGLRTGNLLEPSCGTGNFMGLKPESMDGVKMYGVELDSISGRIAQQLYQKNMISVQGFETTQYPDNFFDCVIGNVPFGNYKVPDQRYDRYNFMIHDYFVAKSLDLVRPGGVIAVITSSRTMDKSNASVREYISNRADLLGAIRLPDNTFAGNAGTEVVTDILFLQKCDMAVVKKAPWTALGMTSEGYVINSYFVEHPEMILGKLAMESTQYGRDAVTVKPMEGMELSEQLRDAISRIKGQIVEYEPADDDLVEQEDVIPAEASVRNFSFTEVNGEVYYRENSQMRHVSLSREAKGRTLGLVSLRNTVRELIDCQMDNGSDREVEVLQERLNSQYEAYTSRYGLINSKTNKKAFDSDSSYSLLASLEILDEDGNLMRKADIFTKRTIRPAELVVSADNSADALALSLSEKACVDLNYMSELLGTPGEYGQIISDLSGAIFLDPTEESPDDPTVGWHTNDDYLSGNVRSKLAVAREYAQKDERFAVNVEYLEKVQPKDLDASEIDVRLGATWIKTEYVQQFMVELFQLKYYRADSIKVQYSSVTGEWEISNKTLDKFNVLANSSYGTTRANGYRLLEDALNLRDTKIYDTVEGDDGKERRVLNSKETTIVQQKQEAIKEAFKDWIFYDITRREDICKTYNTLFNSIRPREYDGSNIRFVGMNPEITLMEHQKNAVAHILYGNNTLLAHCVGAGKSFEMASAAMESVRLGLARKCLFVVPNHLTQQWGSEFLRLYPGANILVATKKDFQPANRRKFCSRIATGQYDAVIIGHSQFEKIPLSLERQKAILQAQVDEIAEAIYEEEVNKPIWDKSKSFSVKQMEKTRRSLENRLAKLNDQKRKDDVVTFEQLGVDRLFVDESHYYKNCYIYTKMRNVAGISQTEALKSSDMLMKCQYLDEITGGKGIIFATGTPVSNSMVEMFTLMRYLQHDTLEKMKLTNFDAWASTFGETVTSIELAPEGTGYRAKTRFARFYNLPELISVFKESADVQTQDMLDLPVPEAEYIDEKLEPSEIQKKYVETFSSRADAVRNRAVDPRTDNMLRITTDGRKLALDQRLIDDMLPDEAVSKVNCCVDNIYDIWKESENNRSAQLVFSDLSTPKSDGSFNIYDDIRNKLEAKGIPPKEIAFIHTANTEVKKEELFKKVRTGQVRILIGSTAKMGAGTNVQDRLIALHHLDVPWKPSDLEQREGRILRQGNQNKKVKIFRYVTEGTFDSYSWQTLENKQKFISQIMTSKSPVRSAEDVDDVALSYAEIKALATANPYIKEKMSLDVDVSKLKLLKANYKSNHYRLESDVAKKYPVEIRQCILRLTDMKKDAEAIEPLLPLDNEHFAMEVNGQQFTNAKEAGEEILSASRALQASKVSEGSIGNYHGFVISCRYNFMLECFVLTLKNNYSYSVNIGRDPLGNITRINNSLKSVINKMIPEEEQNLQSLQQQMENAKEELKKPFAKEQELLEKSARLAELNSLLNMDKKDSTDTVGIDENAPVEDYSLAQAIDSSRSLLDDISRDIDQVRSQRALAV